MTGPEPPAPRKRGCLVGLVVLASFGACFVWTLQAPRIAATAFKEQLRVGMSLSDVVVASFATPRHFVFVRAAEGAPELYVSGSVAAIDRERAEGEQAVRALLERRAAELRVSSFRVTFRASIPVSSSIVVRFGPDARVTAIEGPFDFAD